MYIYTDVFRVNVRWTYICFVDLVFSTTSNPSFFYLSVCNLGVPLSRSI